MEFLSPLSREVATAIGALGHVRVIEEAYDPTHFDGWTNVVFDIDGLRLNCNHERGMFTMAVLLAQPDDWAPMAYLSPFLEGAGLTEAMSMVVDPADWAKRPFVQANLLAALTKHYARIRHLVFNPDATAEQERYRLFATALDQALHDQSVEAFKVEACARSEVATEDIA
jgi:hypothetical protein